MEIVKDFYKKVVYPDGDFYIELIKPTIDFTFRINSPENLWELTHLVDVLNHNNVKPIITIPNLFSAQADKRFKENYSFGYKLIHNFLGNLNANFKVFHPHQEMCELLDNVEIIDNSEFLDEVFSILVENYDYNGNDLDANVVMLFPDGGAYKWGAKLADKKDFRGDVLAAAKNRKFVDGKSVLIQQLPDYDFKGKDVLIIDDICIYGGTVKGLSKILRERNCGKLYLAVSHLTIEDFYIRGEVTDTVFDYFDKVFTTNSKYDNYFVFKTDVGIPPKNLDVIKIF